MNSYTTNSARINQAIADIEQEIARSRIRIVTRSPTPRYPDGYQIVSRGRNQLGEIGIVTSSEQLSRTESFNG
jgi:hypothetical protein